MPAPMHLLLNQKEDLFRPATAFFRDGRKRIRYVEDPLAWQVELQWRQGRLVRVRLWQLSTYQVFSQSNSGDSKCPKYSGIRFKPARSDVDSRRSLHPGQREVFRLAQKEYGQLSCGAARSHLDSFC